MNKLNQYINEKLKIGINTKVKLYNYFPKDKKELLDIIIKLIKERGEDADLNDIDTSKIIDMSNLCMFKENNIIHNIKINEWNVSRVKDMSNMFIGCSNFNCDLNSWDVSKVKNMSGMFYKCFKFNSDISNWNVSKVEDMNDMFVSCKKFDQDLGKWDVTNVKNMEQMFRNCESFEGKGLSNWKVSNCKNMTNMFYKCIYFKENLDDWDVKENVDTEDMFEYCKKLYKKPKWYNDYE